MATTEPLFEMIGQICLKLTVPQGLNKYFILKKMSSDFHILYDFIIHTLQNWLPVNVITVTPISHKYANTISAS